MHTKIMVSETETLDKQIPRYFLINKNFPRSFEFEKENHNPYKTVQKSFNFL